MITGARAMVDGLLEQDVDILFGYPGATICPFYDELAIEEKKGTIKHILVRQEQNAGHMASGYARRTGKPGVCVVTSGPGATNLITGIATAYLDSIPLVAITGQVPTNQLGKDVFQEVDTTGMCAPFVKHSYLVKDAADIPRIMREAFYIASTGRPGPVLIDVPSDIQNTEFEYVDPGEVNIRGYKPSITGNDKQIRKIAREISGAERPLIIAGGGVILSGAEDLLAEFAKKNNIPVVTTMMGLGVLPTLDPLNLGMIGQFGNSPANYALNHTDTLIIVGARVADRAVMNPEGLMSHCKTIHIDIDSAEIGKNMEATVPIVGDVKIILKKLLREDIDIDADEWTREVQEKVAQSRLRPMKRRSNGTVGPKKLMLEVGKQLDDDAYVVADVGQNQIWAAKYINLNKGKFITSGGLGTMGYALPAGMGIKFADPDLQTIVVCGDGSFQMTMNELSTLAEHNLNLKILLVNNGRLGMVNELQRKNFSQGPYAVFLPHTPDFCKLADAYGIAHRMLDDESELEDAVREMLNYDGSFLLECRVGADESTMAQ
ncbi:MAG: biosynthetic-type acetolactate synthase large subunit [Eubacteriales bacterium]|nr:biosynthetic-type acetolactate synthase large subunit [Eubacteriales bacterium]